MTEEEALERLRSCGFYAGTRDWSLGHSIFVGLEIGRYDGIATYRFARSIYQQDGNWLVADMIKTDTPFPSLAEAVDFAMEALEAEAYNCPS